MLILVCKLYGDLYEGRIYQVKTDFIKFLLEKGCKCLNLYGAKLTGSLKLDKPSKLERLNLEECSGKKAVKEILNSCHSLQKVAFQVILYQRLAFFNQLNSPKYDERFLGIS